MCEGVLYHFHVRFFLFNSLCFILLCIVPSSLLQIANFMTLLYIRSTCVYMQSEH